MGMIPVDIEFGKSPANINPASSPEPSVNFIFPYLTEEVRSGDGVTFKYTLDKCPHLEFTIPVIDLGVGFGGVGSKKKATTGMPQSYSRVGFVRNKSESNPSVQCAGWYDLTVL
jgi:hypothetical protein